MKSSRSKKKEFLFGSFVYPYNLIRQDRRTLSLTVTPDLQIYVRCPHDATEERIEIFLKRKWYWLERQLNFFGKFQCKQYKKEYISGEGLYYLGRQYKLVVKRAGEDNVLLQKGILTVFTTHSVADGNYTEKLLGEWYRIRRERIFSEQLRVAASRFEYKSTPTLVIRDMKRRWGSFVNKDKIILSPKLIHAPKDCIEYVITHELCHMRYKNHDKRFFTFLDEKYPRWEKVKDRLEMVGALI